MVPSISDLETPLPRLIVRLVHAARTTQMDTEGARSCGVADALREFGCLALWVIPSHGVFVANDRDVARSVSKIATDHLGFRDAQRELHDALTRIASEEQRDSIECAFEHLRAVSDAAYFYAGLVFGITMSDVE